VTQYAAYTMPAFTGEVAASFILGLLYGSVHEEFTVREILLRVERRWKRTETTLGEIMSTLDVLEDWKQVLVVGHHADCLSKVVRLPRKR
jgi:hypothetical protein